MKGFSFYIAFGRYGGWCIQRDGPSIRMTFGWVAICFLFYDLEVAMRILLDRSLEMEKEIATNQQMNRINR